MTSDRQRINYDRQERLRREQIKRKTIQMRKRKLKKKIVISGIILLLGAVGCFFFLMGKAFGERNTRERIQVSVKEEDLIYPEDIVEEENKEEHNISENIEDELKQEILLVNKNHKLPDEYEVTLKTLPDGVNRSAKEAYEPLCDMLAAGRKEGLAFEICSSYRDVERQKELFEEDVKELMNRGFSFTEAYDEVAKETMPPGYSEHSTGLAFDIVALDYQMLDNNQEDTDENKWLQEHCAEFGFILRYPKGKEDITSISYESWHFRYVGVEAAEYIMSEGITLEEYLEL